MTLDRCGEDMPPQDRCPYQCRKGGWLTPEHADLQRPCPHSPTAPRTHRYRLQPRKRQRTRRRRDRVGRPEDATVTIHRHRPNARRATALCLWCGDTFRPEGRETGYCSLTHKEVARQKRRDRRMWPRTSCDAPHAPSEKYRGAAIARARRTSGELFVCCCGKYHIVERGEGGQSTQLGVRAAIEKAEASE